MLGESRPDDRVAEAEIDGRQGEPERVPGVPPVHLAEHTVEWSIAGLFPEGVRELQFTTRTG